MSYSKRKTKTNLLKKGLKTASSLVLLFSVVVIQTGLFSAYEAHIINVTAKICNYSETRTMGYWKTHPLVYLPLLPQFLGAPGTDEILTTQQQVNQVFLDYNLSARNRLRGQLLAMKFNIAKFGIGGYIDASTTPKTLDDIVAEADDLLRDPNTPDSVLETMKTMLDDLNNLHQIRYCSEGGGTGGPEPNLVINKVYYDVDARHGADPDNEWVELYNPTDAPIDVSGWQICDNNACDTLPTSDLIPGLDFGLIADKNDTWDYWEIPNGVIKIVLNNKIGNGLNNDADILILKDSEGNIVDQMNWGTPDSDWPNYNDDVWNPGVPDVKEGHMLARVPSGFDTDQPSDWQELAVPEVEVLVPNGGEIWYVGRTYNLEWTATNPNGDDDELSIDLWYSKNSGESWVNIIRGTENDGSYAWRIPLVINGYFLPSEHARIKVVAWGPENFMVQDWDMSDDDFCPPIDYGLLTSEEIEILKEMGLIEEASEELVGEVATTSDEIATTTEEEIATSTTEEIATTTEETNDLSQETATPTEEIIVPVVEPVIENDSTSNENQESGGIVEVVDEVIEAVNETIDAVVEGIVEEIIPDEPAGETVENPADNQISEGQIFEQAQTEEALIIEQVVEQAPGIEEQAVVAPGNDSDVAPSGGDSSGESGVVGGEAVSGDSSPAPAGEATSGE